MEKRAEGKEKGTSIYLIKQGLSGWQKQKGVSYCEHPSGEQGRTENDEGQHNDIKSSPSLAEVNRVLQIGKGANNSWDASFRETSN